MRVLRSRGGDKLRSNLRIDDGQARILRQGTSFLRTPITTELDGEAGVLPCPRWPGKLSVCHDGEKYTHVKNALHLADASGQGVSR
jgi:hypothetical protein